MDGQLPYRAFWGVQSWQRQPVPTVFLSYTREDVARVTALEQVLHERGIDVWRDQESLRGGQQWPKEIGEAIGSRDFFLLAWSKSALSSHFVEFEWTTAVALRKPVLPCLLDSTPLPPALKAVEGIDINMPDAPTRLSAALQVGLPPPSLGDHVSRVLLKLANIGSIAPNEVASRAMAMYAQQGWTVQGNLYQANGNMYVTIQQPAESGTNTPRLEIWSKRATLAGAVLGIIISLIAFSEKFFPSFATTPLRGVVLDTDQQPVVDATVEVDQLPGKSQITTSDGSFVFDKVPGNKGDRVRVFVKKPKYSDHNEYVALPGPVRIKIEDAK